MISSDWGKEWPIFSFNYTCFILPNVNYIWFFVEFSKRESFLKLSIFYSKYFSKIFLSRTCSRRSKYSIESIWSKHIIYPVKFCKTRVFNTFLGKCFSTYRCYDKYSKQLRKNKILANSNIGYFFLNCKQAPLF